MSSAEALESLKGLMREFGEERRRIANETPVSVYIFATGQGRVKVGVSKNPLKRMRVVARTSGVDITRHHSRKCANRAEAMLIEQRMLKEFSSDQGEWIAADFDTVKQFLSVQRTTIKKDT